MASSSLTKNRYADVNREQIEMYLISPQGIELNELQKTLYNRWVFADEKIREFRYKKGQIAEFIIKRFGVCRDTAWRDIVNAELLFSSSAPLNKKYRLGILIEFYEKQAQLAAANNDYDAVARLGKVLEGLYKIYPDYQAPQSPRKVTFNVFGNNYQPSNPQMTEDAAFDILNNELNKSEDDR